MDLDPETADELFAEDRSDSVSDVELDPHVRVEADPAGYSARITFGDEWNVYELTSEDRVDLLDELAEREDIGDEISMWDVIAYPVTTIRILEGQSE